MLDVYAHWRNALREPNEQKKITPLPTLYQGGQEDPQPGLYRVRNGLNRNGGVLVPVKIYIENDEGQPVHKIADETVLKGGELALTGEVDGKPVSDKRLADIWLHCQPVSKAAMDHYAAHGHWPDEAPRLSNNAPTDPLACLESYMEEAAAWIAKTKIETKQLADMAGNYVAEILKLRKKADEDRDDKIRPHLEAQRDINGKYKPALDHAKTLTDKIRAASEAFLKAERDRLRAEEQARYEAEKKAREEEIARIQAERAEFEKANPIAAYTDPEPELPPPPKPPEDVKVLAGGARGKRMGLRTVTEYVVTDYDALLAFVAKHPKVMEAVESAGKAMAKAGTQVPGITTQEVEKVQ